MLTWMSKYKARALTGVSPTSEGNRQQLGDDNGGVASPVAGHPNYLWTLEAQGFLHSGIWATDIPHQDLAKHQLQTPKGYYEPNNAVRCCRSFELDCCCHHRHCTDC